MPIKLQWPSGCHCCVGFAVFFALSWRETNILSRKQICILGFHAHSLGPTED
jgi:hypothetical protein